MSAPLDHLLTRIRACRVCAPHLPLGPRPVLQAGTGARLLIVGQAPGTKVHASGVPWDDRSGQRMRDWLQLDTATFYDPARARAFCATPAAGARVSKAHRAISSTAQDRR
ncbi:MAG TPA: uracil-DNA glycosylase family protein [Lysobacter sp.]|nr:uracil-DNA glycosylase family protein [Lysobacter sp.]